LIPQVGVHRFALEHGDGAGALAQFHRIQCDQAMEAGQAIEQREADGTPVEAEDIVPGVAGGEPLQSVDAGAVVCKKAVTDTEDGD
jgi:hypothetical protein